MNIYKILYTFEDFSKVFYLKIPTIFLTFFKRYAESSIALRLFQLCTVVEYFVGTADKVFNDKIIKVLQNNSQWESSRVRGLARRIPMFPMRQFLHVFSGV
jgi:hypothetical protein